MAIAAAVELGVDPHQAAAAMVDIEQIAGRYKIIRHGRHEVRLLLAKNPAGWAETIGLLDEAKALLVVVNARDADGRDTSWLWDVGFENVRSAAVMACGERAADLGLRLSYADIPHTTRRQQVEGRERVLANYTAFHQLRRRIGRGIG
jgi:UDP-N-acetylmuramyl tripeptide synthase